MSLGKQLHHRLDYIEINVSDLQRAKNFYGAAFGWQFNDYGPSYAGIKGEHGEIGGMSVTTKVSSGGPLLILYSNDLPASEEQVTAAGGEISRETFDFPGGKRFHFRDPCGNELAIWTPAK